jgi:malonyl-CoA O-methyltransferase
MLNNPALPGIAKRFSQAATAYNQYAKVQKQTAENLVNWLLQSPQGQPLAHNGSGHILELGCGTGLLTEQLQQQWPHAHISACDISPQMLAIAQSNIKPKQKAINWILDDASQLQTPHELDWIVSNFCIQWFKDIYLSFEHHLKKCQRLSFAVPCQGSFANWENAHTQLGLSAGLWPLPNHEKIIVWFEKKRLKKQLNFFQYTMKTHVLQFDQALDFARMLKGLGAHTSCENHKPVPLQRILKRLPVPFETHYQVLYVDVITTPA